MKQFVAVVFLLAALSVCSAISVDEVIQLSKLKTGDDLILQTIEKSGLDRPVTPADIIRMKQEGVSERVIEAMLKQSNSGNDGDNLRSFTITNKKGQKVKVFTNLDMNGKRMGGPAPEPAPVFELPEIPKEVTIVVKHERPAREEEYEQPSYAGPAYSSYGSYGGYYPYAGLSPYWYSQVYRHPQHCCADQGFRSPQWWGTVRDSTYPLVRQRPTPQPAPAAPAGGFAATKPRTSGFSSVH